jgi:hypothetical protein
VEGAVSRTQRRQRHVEDLGLERKQGSGLASWHRKNYRKISSYSQVQPLDRRTTDRGLRGELTDAVMMGDYDRLASLSTEDGIVRIPHINEEAVSREGIRAGVERLQALRDSFVQTTHPGTIQLEEAPGRRGKISQVTSRPVESLPRREL